MRKKIISLLYFLMGVLTGSFIVYSLIKPIIKRKKRLQELADKHLRLYLLMNNWVRLKQKGKNVSSYFKKNNYRKIAIYGMSYVGETLLSELKGTEVLVKYAIDQKTDNFNSMVDIISPDSDLDKVDCIVVTAVYYFDEIEELLSKKMDCAIISIEDILYDLLEKEND